MIIAGIVLYNPDNNRLEENIESIKSQVDKVVLIENGSNVASKNATANLIKKYRNVIVIENAENYGIAAALNQIMQYAEENHARWTLTLDQDSVCSGNLIEQYQNYINIKNVASITCRIKDRNFNLDNSNTAIKDYEYVDFCITSGNFISVKTWNEIGRFDERLFIDRVDSDFCYRLKQHGYLILKVNYFGLLHEIGSNTREKKILGKHFYVFNHSPFRCYYLVRNQIYFSRKHRKSLGIKQSLRIQRTAWTRVIVYVIYEKKKLLKIKAWIKGLIDGYTMHI